MLCFALNENSKKLLCLLAFVPLLGAASSPPPTITVGSLTLTHCVDTYDGYCGTITQPLDRSGALPGTLTVGFEFYPHTKTTEPPAGLLIAEEGGPGYSTTGSRDGYVRLLDPLRDTRDILLVDKRGTGRSSPIYCAALQKAYLPSELDVAACASQLGESAWFYRSADSADDLAAVIAALQLGPADYYGDSYATWFGEVFAVRHPNLVRSMVLDSAYPVTGDNFISEVDHGQQAMDIACKRSAPCRALGSSATARFAALLAALRQNPVSGTAPGGDGEPRHVTANPAGLFLIIANAGNTPDTWRDLDAAGRAWMEAADPQPLLRLLAEARDSYSGGGSAEAFSVGLADSVICSEYSNLFNLSDDLARRLQQFHHSVANLRALHPTAFAPFTIDDAVFSQMDSEAYNVCLPWPSPPAGVVAAQPVPPNAQFPAVPVLVISGELDTVTSPIEGQKTAALFSNSTFIETPNMIHESAVGDGGVFVPPNGQDLGQCVGPIVRNFLLTGGSTGDTSCLADIRPIRTVPAFATSYATVAPARALAGNQTDATGLALASAAAETVGDVVSRYYVTTSGKGAGLRGGTFRLEAAPGGYRFHLDKCAWASDLIVNGDIDWHQITGAIIAKITFTAAGHAGTETIRWNDQETEAHAHLTGTVDGATLNAERIAP